MTLERGVIGYALYMEFRRNDTTQQLLFTPPFVDRGSRTLVDPVVLARSISADRPRAKWRTRSVEVPTISADSSKVAEFDSLDAGAAAMQPLLAVLGQTLSNNSRMAWTVVGSPLIVEMTERDGIALRDRDKPDALQRRAMAARADGGYPAAVYVGGGAADTTEDEE
jgi:hypothetical protein